MGKKKRFLGNMLSDELLESEGRRFELVCNSELEREFEKIANVTRTVRNSALEYKKTMWNQWRINTKAHDIIKELPILKKTEGFEWTGEVPSQCLQQTILDLDIAYKNFFTRGGFPKFQKKNSKSGMSFRFPRSAKGFKIERLSKKKWTLDGVPQFKSLKFIGNDKKSFVSEIKNMFDITSITISKEYDKWFVSLTFLKLKNSEMDVSDNAIGIDRGIAISYACSNKKTYTIPQKLKKLENKIARLQMKSRRQKTKSNNKKKTYKKIAKIHTKIRHIRLNFLQKTTTTIVKNHNIVMIENLKVKNMSKSAKGTLKNPGKMVKQKSGLNRAILRQGWGKFERMLEYKLKRKHGKLVKVDPKFTSQKCCECGHIDKNSRQNQEDFLCTNCGAHKNADINAAINILTAGLAGRINDCGGRLVGDSCEAVTSGEDAQAS